MKTYKKIDFWISVLLITGFTIVSCARQDQTFFVGYFVVGAWHIISMVFHAANKWFTQKGSLRYYYHWIVTVIFTTAVLGYFISSLLVIVLYLMLIAAPIMAVYYTRICYEEVYVKMKRPMALLK